MIHDSLHHIRYLISIFKGTLVREDDYSYMRKFDEDIHRSCSWMRDCILLIYIFMMLIFKNGLDSKLGEDKFFFLILIGILGILFVYRIIIFMWSKFGTKNKKGEVSDE